jgi:haloacetate dehalogenase
MPDLADIYPGYASHWIDTAAGKIFTRAGGSGLPLLLLHGHPQSNVMNPDATTRALLDFFGGR